jgi:hypothetical protein
MTAVLGGSAVEGDVNELGSKRGHHDFQSWATIKSSQDPCKPRGFERFVPGLAEKAIGRNLRFYASD